MTKKRVALATVLSAAVGVAAFTGVAGTAKADPMQYNALVGVGSDTVQDVANAFAGFTNGVDYTPLHSSSASGYRQLISFDAVKPGTSSTTDCIPTKLGGPSLMRPNGSGAGQKALSRAMDGTGWGTVASGCGVVDVSGQLDFARSSSGPNNGDTGTDLTFIPFARDGVSFAYYQADTSDQGGHPTITSLTRKQLVDLFTTGPQTINGTRVVPCGIQSGSGTYKFWNTVTTASTNAENTSTAECNALISNSLSGRSEENNTFQLKARGDALSASNVSKQYDQVIIGFSAASFIAKYNGAAPCGNPSDATCAVRSAVGVGLGSVTDTSSTATPDSNNLGAPLTITDGVASPRSTFFNNSTLGRRVYFILPTAVLSTPVSQYKDVKSLFVGGSSAVCSATTVINKFGFLTTSECGDTSTYKGSYQSGQS